jgi:hypothetical protein
VVRAGGDLQELDKVFIFSLGDIFQGMGWKDLC